jgi:hypothetical protein
MHHSMKEGLLLAVALGLALATAEALTARAPLKHSPPPSSSGASSTTIQPAAANQSLARAR